MLGAFRTPRATRRERHPRCRATGPRACTACGARRPWRTMFALVGLLATVGTIAALPSGERWPASPSSTAPLEAGVDDATALLAKTTSTRSEPSEAAPLPHASVTPAAATSDPIHSARAGTG